MADTLNNGKRVYRLDLEKLTRLKFRERLTREKFLLRSGLSNRTATRIEKGKPVQMSTIDKIAKMFGIEDGSELVHPDELMGNEVQRGQRVVGDYVVTGSLGVWETASNTLQYRIYKLQHRFLPDRWGRGKRYDLSELADEDRRAIQEQLRRHPTVCGLVGRHPNITTNITAAPDSSHDWWVIDEWIDGRRLFAEMDERRFTIKEAARIAHEVAAGLAALHEAGVIRRELSPDSVILEAKSGRVVLTEFELAKLTDGRPTVSCSQHWPVDRYRSPEVTAGRRSMRRRISTVGDDLFCISLPVGCPRSATKQTSSNR